MDRTEKVELANICMIYKDDKLLLQNIDKKHWKGWGFPGGHLERGESVVDSVIREVKEETGLRIDKPKFAGIKQFQKADGSRYLIFLFKTDKFQGRLESSEEGEMRWISRDELEDYNLVVDFYDMLEFFEDDSLIEFQYVSDGESLIKNIK